MLFKTICARFSPPPLRGRVRVRGTPHGLRFANARLRLLPLKGGAEKYYALLFALTFLITNTTYAQETREPQFDEPAAADATHSVHIPGQYWSFAGPFGHYDRAQLQRGYQVYREVCASCHGLELLSFRNLAEPGGPEIPVDQAKAIAAEARTTALDDSGQPIEKPAELKDRFPSPFANEKAAAASNNGKAPPDLSVMAKARSYERGFPLFLLDIFTGRNQLNGPDYIYALLTGYENPPQGTEVPAGLSYNKYFPGHFIAMPKPLNDGQVQYQDGSPATVDQYSRDVTAFLMWAAEPKMEERKRIGFQVMVFLLFFATLLYLAKKKLWDDLKNKTDV